MRHRVAYLTCLLLVNLTLQSVKTSPSSSNGLAATTAYNYVTASFGLATGVTVNGNACTDDGQCTYKDLALGPQSFNLSTASKLPTDDTIPNILKHVFNVTRGELYEG